MFGILLIIAGVVGLEINHLFTGQETISWLLVGVGGFLVLLQFVVFAIAAIGVSKGSRDIRRRW